MRVSSVGAFVFAGAFIVMVCGTSSPTERSILLVAAAAPGDDVPRAGDAPAEPGEEEGLLRTADGSDRTDSDGGYCMAPEEVTADPDADLDGGSCAPCPDDMVYVDTTFCPDLERRCTDLEYEKINHLPICHVFAQEQVACRLHKRRISFCIDRYEYPNRKGAHVTRMLDWYQAQATCESEGKRLCWASEWTAACEGPEHTPFPYGWSRDHNKCNIDNFYIEPRRFGPNGQFYFYARDPDIRARELERLDQSIPSGSMSTCRSGFDVYDQTGNVDEWVTSDIAPREASMWAGLKGGAWGHVRNQCRPTTFSHQPGFAYYFVGFRCCQDVEGAPKWTPSANAMPAPRVEPHDFAPEEADVARGPGPSRTKFTRPREARGQ